MATSRLTRSKSHLLELADTPMDLDSMPAPQEGKRSSWPLPRWTSSSPTTEGQMEQLQQRYQALLEEHSELEQSIDHQQAGLCSQIRKLDKELQAAMAEIEEARAEVQAAQAETVRANSESQVANTEAAKARAECRSLCQQLRTSQADTAQAKVECQELHQELRVAQEECDRLQADLQGTRSGPTRETEDLRAECSGLMRENEQLEAECRDLKQRLQAGQKENEGLQRDCQGLYRRLKDKDIECTTVRDRLSAVQAEQDNLTEQNWWLKNQLAQAQEDHQRADTQAHSAQAALEEYRQRAEGAEHRALVMERELSGLQAQQQLTPAVAPVTLRMPYHQGLAPTMAQC